MQNAIESQDTIFLIKLMKLEQIFKYIYIYMTHLGYMRLARGRGQVVEVEQAMEDEDYFSPLVKHNGDYPSM